MNNSNEKSMGYFEGCKSEWVIPYSILVKIEKDIDEGYRLSLVKQTKEQKQDHAIAVETSKINTHLNMLYGDNFKLMTWVYVRYNRAVKIKAKGKMLRQLRRIVSTLERSSISW